MAWIDFVMQWWNLLTQGKIIEAVIASYATYEGSVTGILGFWFYVIVMFLGMLMIYMKTQNFSGTVLVGLIISAGAIPFMPYNIFLLMYVMIILGFTFIFYKLLSK